jgi:hypothetical protein
LGRFAVLGLYIAGDDCNACQYKGQQMKTKTKPKRKTGEVSEQTPAAKPATRTAPPEPPSGSTSKSEPTLATKNGPWWREMGYVLVTKPCARRGTNELAGCAVMVQFNCGSEPIAMLVGFPTSPHRDAGKAIWLAKQFIEAANAADDGFPATFTPLTEPDVIDWTDQGEPPEKPVNAFPSREWFDLASQFDQVHENIVKTCPPGHRLRDLFDLVRPDEDLNAETAPPPSAIKLALDEFLKEHENEKRRILNGWASTSIEISARQQLESVGRASGLRAALMFETIPGDPASLQWGIQTIAGTGRPFSPITLTIAPGASKIDVVHAIDAMLEEIQHHWPTIIATTVRRQS